MRRWTVVGFAIALVAMVVVLLAAGGAPQPSPEGLPDSGPVVGWGVSVAKLTMDFAAAATIGFLLLAAFLLPSTSAEAEGLAVDAIRIGRRSAWVWVGATGALYLCTAAEFGAEALHRLSFRTLWSLTADTTLGRLIVAQLIAATLVAVALRWTLSLRAVAGWLGVATASLALIAFTGHSAVIGAHDLATVSLFLHLVGVSLWVGGLAALGWLGWRGSKRRDAAVRRFAVLATWAFVIVGASGVAGALIRFDSAGQLTSSGYGRVIVAKALAFMVLGAIAWRQRRTATFGRLVIVELLVMAGTIGIAAGLGRTPGAADPGITTPAENLLGGPLPAEPTLARLLTGFEPSGVGLAIVGLGVALYLQGLLVLRRRGDAWPIGRTIAWFSGLCVVGWATFGGLGAYSHVMFSTHMVAHMMLSMVAPILLVLGAPVTLALRSLPGARQPGEPSPRAMLVAVIGSRPLHVLTHPVTAAAIFVGSLYTLYFTPLFEESMRGTWGHGLMELHFLASGALFYYVLVGIDPSPRAIPPIARFGILLVTIPFHAFFAIAVMSSKQVFAETYWMVLDRPYATDLLRDQYVGGSIAWAMGEVPLILVMGALFVQWIRSDARDAKRLDRAAERDDDAELKAYNERLQALHERRNPRG